MLIKRGYVFAFLIAMVATTFGQGGMGMMDFTKKLTTSVTRLLADRDIKKEMKLSGDQNKKIDKITKEHAKQFGDLGKKMQSKGADMNAMMAAMKEMDDLQDAADKSIVAELTPEQQTRLRQIRLQALGTGALDDPDVQKEIGLTPEQISDIEAYNADGGNRMLQAYQSGKDMSKKIRELHQMDQKVVLEKLTPEQREKFKTVLGPECKAAIRIAENGI